MADGATLYAGDWVAVGATAGAMSGVQYEGVGYTTFNHAEGGAY